MKLGLIVKDEWPLGKHKGKKMFELTSYYLSWVIFDSTLDSNLKDKARVELELRGNKVEELFNGSIDESTKDLRRDYD